MFQNIALIIYTDFYCINCFHLFRTKDKLKKHINVCKNHDYCYIEMRKDYNKILKYIYGQRCIKVPFIVYIEAESLLEIINNCYNNPEKSSKTKINKLTPSGYLLFTHCSFDVTKNKLDYYRGKECMKNLCKDLREHIMKIIKYENKEMIPLTIKENQSYHEQ